VKTKEDIGRKVESFLRELEVSWQDDKTEELGRCHDDLVGLLRTYPRIVLLSAIEIYKQELIDEILQEVKEKKVPKTPCVQPTVSVS